MTNNDVKNKAVTFENQAAQGDVFFKRIDEIPDVSGMKEEQKDANGNYILAHSETGHHHVIDGNVTEAFNKDEFVSYMKVNEATNIRHLRDYDTHAPIQFKPGVYKVVRQREYTPQGLRRVQD